MFDRTKRGARETRGSLRALSSPYTPSVARVPPDSATDYTDVARVFIDSRYALFIAQRCGTRVNQLISPLWDDRGFVRHSIPAALLGLDAAVFRWIKRDERLNLAPRLALDAAEVFFTALTAVRDDYDESAIPLVPGCPLAVEAAARMGLPGLVVPLVNGLAFASARRLRGREPKIGLIGWQVAGSVGGLALTSYGRRRRAAELERHRRELAARIERAETEGRSNIAAGTDALIDAVQRATVLVHLATGHDAENRAGTWKAELAHEIRQDYAFLGDVVVAFQSESNAVPDLRAIVQFDIDEAAGAVLLSRDQAAELRDRLSELGLRGRHHVTARSDRSGTEVTIGDRTIRLALAERDVKLNFDAVPGGFAWSALWLAVANGKTRENVPAWASFGPAALALAAVFGLHRDGVRRGSVASRPKSLAITSVLTIGSTIVQTLTMGNVTGAGGTSRFPFTLSMRGYGLVAVLCWRDLSSRGRSAAGGVGLLNGVIGWLLTPKPRSRREGVADLAWPAQSVALAGSLAAAIDNDAAALAEALRADDYVALDEARERGRVAAEAFARTCVDEARETLRENGPELSPDVLAECERRLASCEARLADLEARTVEFA